MKRVAIKKYNFFKNIFAVIKYYFPCFMEFFSRISVSRHQSDIIHRFANSSYSTMFLSDFCHHRSLRHMNESFDNECVINIFRVLFDVQYDEIPYGDIINNNYKNIFINQFRKILYGATRNLINKKCVNDYRIENKYYQFIIDGVDRFIYDKNAVKMHLLIMLMR